MGMRRWSLFNLALILLSVPSLADDRPNFVIILCDDLGYGDLQCYGHPHIKTPNLDQLAEQGIRFTQCYSAAPVCSPSRVGLLTGRSPNRAGVYDWIPEARRPTANRRELVHMRQSEITIPSLLKSAGYDTCMAGKWHCNSEFNNQKQPQPGDFGFDHWMATQNNAAPSHRHPKNFVRNGKPVGEIQSFSCQIAVDEALSWLTDRESEKPFFLFLPFHEPHEPVASPPDLVDAYRDVAENEDQAQYFANVANVDAAVGKLVRGLQDLSQRENTLIIFTSDNGPETLKRYRGAGRSYGTPGPLRGMKLHTTDAGFRVAGIVNWKGHVKPSQVVDTPISSLDFLPTLCQLANARLPEIQLDGTSMLPALKGQSIDRPRPLVWAYFNAINEHRVAMRLGNYKVLAKLNGGDIQKLTNITRELLPKIRDAELTDVEVYDVTKDIAESNNLAATDTELAQKLKQRLSAEYQALVRESHVW